ncbi:hypothetical protein PENTCL1PPCAC_9225, partial [Pristionchus entomophagus]
IYSQDWQAEQQKYLNELAKHGFAARERADMMRTRDMALRLKFGDFLKEVWDVYARTILKNALRHALMLAGASDASASETVVWLSDRLYQFAQTAGYRTFANTVERPIGFVLSNVPILLRDGPRSPNFIPY